MKTRDAATTSGCAVCGNHYSTHDGFNRCPGWRDAVVVTHWTISATDRRWLSERALYRLATRFEIAAYWLTMKRRKGNDDDDT